MQWISNVPFMAHHAFHRAKRNKDTGYWLTENEKYRTWRRAKSSSIIWLRGDGKFSNFPVLLISTLTWIQLALEKHFWRKDPSRYYLYCNTHFLQQVWDYRSFPKHDWGRAWYHGTGIGLFLL